MKNPLAPSKNIASHFYKSKITYRLRVIKKSKNNDPKALHLLLPHCLNWQLTQICINAYLKLTRRPLHITLVNNFDLQQCPTEILNIDRLTYLRHDYTFFGKSLRSVIRSRDGSVENALALDAALSFSPEYEWAFMSHTDSAPLSQNWDDAFFEAMGENLIIGNYTDRIRIHAAHASGSLFHQKSFLQKNKSMQPVYKHNVQILDVGDQATLSLYQMNTQKKNAPVLPNNINHPEIVLPYLKTNHAFLHALALDGSCISLNQSGDKAIFGHLGRGTPRSLADKRFANKLPYESWIDYLNEI